MPKGRLARALLLLAALGTAAYLALREDPDPAADVAPAPPSTALPPLDPAIQALGAEVRRIRGPEAIAELRRRLDRRASTLESDAEVEEKVRGAIDRLGAAIRTDPVVSTALGGAVDRADAMAVFADDDPEASLRYDALRGAIQIPRCAAEWPVDLLATAIGHELVHEADHRDVAAALGLSTEELALLMGDLAGSTRGRLHVIDLEDRALRVELRVARALGVALPSPDAVPTARPEAGCPMHPDDLLFTLARLQAVERDRAAWSAALDRLFPP